MEKGKDLIDFATNNGVEIDSVIFLKNYAN